MIREGSVFRYGDNVDTDVIMIPMSSFPHAI